MPQVVIQAMCVQSLDNVSSDQNWACECNVISMYSVLPPGPIFGSKVIN